MAKEDTTLVVEEKVVKEDPKQAEMRNKLADYISQLEISNGDKTKLVDALTDAGYHNVVWAFQKLGPSLAQTMRGFYDDLFPRKEGKKYDPKPSYAFLTEYMNYHAVETGQKTELQVIEKRSRQKEKRISEKSGR